jgi:hypothetical protein
MGMVELIGFMIGVYTACRLIQVPLQMLGRADWSKIPQSAQARFLAVVGISGLGVLLLVGLMIGLVVVDVKMSKAARDIQNLYQGK